MKQHLSSLFLICISTFAFQAQAAVVDCTKFDSIDKKSTFEADPTELQQCMLRGFDPPVSWRKDNGKSAGTTSSGSGGFAYGSVQAPDEPPGVAGAAASVSKNTMENACKFSLRKGLPPSVSFGSCSKFFDGLIKGKDGNTSSGDTGGLTDDTCPAESDTTGLFGVKQRASLGAAPLACGGATPIKVQRITMSSQPTYMAVTEGDFYIRVYKKDASGNFLEHATVALPNVVANEPCGGEGGCYCLYTYNLTPPLPQTFLYNGGLRELQLRLSDKIPTTSPEVQTSGGYRTDLPEWLLTMQLSDGVPNVQLTPSGCPDEVMYLNRIEPAEIPSDFILESPVAECTGNAETCGNSISTQSCDTLSLFPKSPIEPDICAGKTQYAVLNTGNIVFPANSTPRFYSIQNRTGLLVSSTGNARDKAKIYTASSSDLKIGRSAPVVRIEEGGIIRMSNGDNLIVSPYAVIHPSISTIDLMGGGTLTNSAGYLKSSIPAGTRNYSLAGAAKPLSVSLGRSMDLPEGYLLPTVPSPYVRLPMDKVE